jgi:VIT1/CCC1 family predicted Fe2+/Mn2+ transporter
MGMKTAWVSLNLIGLALIVGGAIYTIYHKAGISIVFVGMVSLGISNIIRTRIFRNR